MRAANLRLWFLAVLTVAVGSWWQLPTLSADAPDSGHRIVYGAGSSKHSQLGNVTGNVSPPQPIPLGIPADALDAAVGAEHTLIVTTDGLVLGVGSNMAGQLGIPVPSAPMPVPIPGLQNIVAVAAGAYHSLALDADGNLWGWGRNSSGQVGTGSAGGAVTVPTQIFALTGVIDMAAGEDFSVAVTSDGTLWTWGANAARQLGDNSVGRNAPGSVPSGNFSPNRVAAGGRTALAMSATGGVVGWGNNLNRQVQNSVATSVLPVSIVASNARAIAVGDQHTLVALNDGTVRARGLGTSGQIGTASQNISPDFVTVPGLSNVVAVAAGAAHSIAITGNGGIWAWGANEYGQLGMMSLNATVPAPTQVIGVPMTAKTADAHGVTSLFLHAPGELGVNFNIPLNWSCSTPFNASVSLTGYNAASVTPSDIVLVLDESGSITPPNFLKMKQFAINFVNAQDTTQTRIGVVFFSNSSRVIADLTDSKTELIDAIAHASYLEGQTCIGCGVSTADTTLDTQGRAGAKRVMVVATDGNNNVQNATFASTITKAQQTSTLFAVGIGAAVDADQIDFIASDVPGVQTAFMTPDFESLTEIVTQLGVTIGPAISNLIATFTVAPTFALNGTPSVTSGNVTVNANQLTWIVPSLGASPISLNFAARGIGIGGDLPVFSSASYQLNGETHDVTGPNILLVGCPASIVLSPPVAVHFVGQTHVGNVTVLDTVGSVLKVPSTVTITSGPNSGRSFNVSGFASTFGYTSNRSGIDELVATLPGSPIQSESVVVAWEVPNSPPSVNISPNQTIPLNGSPTATFTVFAFASDDGNTLPLTTQWYENDAPVPGGTDVPVLTLTRLAGKYTFNFQAFDGEHTASAFVTVDIVDGTPPVITSLSGGPEGDNGWHIGPFTAAWSVEDPESAFTTTDCSAKTFANDGVNQTATCNATSAGGTSSASVTVKIDQTKPTVAAPAPVTAEATGNIGAIVSYSGESATDALSGIATFGCTPASNSQFSIGTTPITCTARDAAGNSATGLSSVTVRDTTAPTLVMPPDATLFGILPTGAQHIYTVTATDIVDTLVSVQCDHSGFFFPYGTTTVTCTATDDHSNQSTGTFTVTVNHPETMLALIVPSSGSVGSPLQITAVLSRTSFPGGPLGLFPVRFVVTGPGTSIDTSVLTMLNGTVHFFVTPTERGVYTVTAYYDGDGVLLPSTAGPFTATVYQRTQLFVITANGTAGESLIQAAELIAQPQGTRLAGRPVHLSFAGPGAPPPLDLVTDAGGRVETFATFAVAGTHTITASFSAADFITDAAGTVPPVPTTAVGEIVITPVFTAFDNPQVDPQVALVGGDLTVATSLHRSTVPAGPLAGRPVTLTLTAPSGATTTRADMTNSGGFANVVFPLMERGIHTLVATYAGDAATAPASSSPRSIPVYQRTMLTVAPVIGTAGTDVTLNATLVLVPQNTPLDGQPVSFSSNGIQPNPQTATTDGTGAASVTGTYATAGAYLVTAMFDGNADFFTNRSGAFPLVETESAPATIAAASTGFTLNAPSASLVAEPLTVTATLSRTAAPAGVVANAVVGFTLTGPSPSTATMTLLATTDAAGTATTIFEPTERGSYSVSVRFEGDSTLAASTSAPATVNVYQRTRLTLAPVNGGANRLLPVVATLTALPQNSGLINQQVHFSFGGIVAPQTAQTGAGGVATVQVSFPSVGSFGAHAVFSNAADFLTDAAGSIPPAPSTADAPITIADSTPPVITPTITGVLGPNDWYTSNVDVSWNVADPESGIDTSTGCSSSTTSLDGTLFTFTCTAASAGGSSTQTVTFKRDATAPTLTLPAGFSVPATTAAGAIVNYVVTRSDATSGVAAFNCAPASGAQFAIGTTTVSCTVTDHAGHSTAGSFAVTVSDAIPPVIASATPNVSSLSPPNHQMVPITIAVSATDNIAPPPVCSIVSVSSNEPQNGLGDGDTPNDWLITGPLTVQLRAERSGNGNGRVYTITVECVDGAGNTATSTTTVSVPKGKK